MIDSNDNGKISADELEHASRGLGYNPSKKEVKEMISSVDGNADGQIDFKEFAMMMKDQFGALEYQETAIKDSFKLLDKDGNGYIDQYDELRTVLLQRGESLTEEEFQKVVDDLDANRDGKIEYEELATKMCRVKDDD